MIDLKKIRSNNYNYAVQGTQSAEFSSSQVNQIQKETALAVIEEIKPILETAIYDMERAAFEIDGKIAEAVPDNVIESTGSSTSLLISVREIKAKLTQLKTDLQEKK